jgi:excisionase family DNA binding protein
MSEKEPLYTPDRNSRNVKEIDDLRAKQEGVAKLVSASGEVRELPHSEYKVVEDLLGFMDQGVRVELLPVHTQLTTQEAADVLGVSRPHLVKLLEDGNIPYYKVGKHRRIRLDELLVYKERRDSGRREALDLIKKESEELGLYDVEDG